MENHNEDLLNEQYFVEELIKDFQSTQMKIDHLKERKEKLGNDIMCAYQHKGEGQKTYDYDLGKVEVRTPYVYSIDKSKYKSGEIELPERYNPIKESISLTVDKKVCNFIMDTAPISIQLKVSELITRKPGKASVTIKERM